MNWLNYFHVVCQSLADRTYYQPCVPDQSSYQPCVPAWLWQTGRLQVCSFLLDRENRKYHYNWQGNDRFSRVWPHRGMLIHYQLGVCHLGTENLRFLGEITSKYLCWISIDLTTSICLSIVCVSLPDYICKSARMQSVCLLSEATPQMWSIGF